MMNKAKPKRDDSEQSERFLETARTLCVQDAESEKEFSRTMSVLLKAEEKSVKNSGKSTSCKAGGSHEKRK